MIVLSGTDIFGMLVCSVVCIVYSFVLGSVYYHNKKIERLEDGHERDMSVLRLEMEFYKGEYERCEGYEKRNS